MNHHEWVMAQAQSRLAAHTAWTRHVNAGGDPFEVEASPYISPANWARAKEDTYRSALTRGS